MTWLLQRMKAVMGLAIPAVTAAILKAVEGGIGFDIPTEYEVAIISVITGLFVHQTPNAA